MTVRQVVLDVAMAGVVLSLISITFFFVAGAAVCLFAAAAERLGRRRRARRLGGLSHGCDVAELADIDRTLDLIMAAEGGVRHARDRAA